MKLCEFIDQPILDKATPSPEALSYRYRVSLDDIFDQMFIGMIVELEHTTNVMAAMEIALDHLGENLHYYQDLSKIEMNLPDDPEVDENRSRMGKPGKKRKKIYPGQSSAMLANYVARKYGGEIGCGRASQIINDPDVNKNIRNRAIWYKSLHCRGRKQVRELSNSCEL